MLWPLLILIACGSYIFLWFRYDLYDGQTLAFAAIWGVIALASLAYTVVSPTAHHRVTKVLAGVGALVGTFCSGAFLYYSWTEREKLWELAILPFFAVITLLALAAT